MTYSSSSWDSSPLRLVLSMVPLASALVALALREPARTAGAAEARGTMLDKVILPAPGRVIYTGETAGYDPGARRCTLRHGAAPALIAIPLRYIGQSPLTFANPVADRAGGVAQIWVRPRPGEEGDEVPPRFATEKESRLGIAGSEARIVAGGWLDLIVVVDPAGPGEARRTRPYGLSRVALQLSTYSVPLTEYVTLPVQITIAPVSP